MEWELDANKEDFKDIIWWTMFCYGWGWYASHTVRRCQLFVSATQLLHHYFINAHLIGRCQSMCRSISSVFEPGCTCYVLSMLNFPIGILCQASDLHECLMWTGPIYDHSWLNDVIHCGVCRQYLGFMNICDIQYYCNKEWYLEGVGNIFWM